MTEILTLTKALINCPSVTPEDGGCQQLLVARLQHAGFAIEHLPFGEVKNLWARRGDKNPLIVFLGHTDVVPPGPLDAWQFPPFIATEHDGYLYGRGAQDMKSNIAAMIVACEKFIAAYPQHEGSIGFIITSDEEGPAINGTKQVVNYLRERNIFVDYCIVGEPSSTQQTGDTIKVGRRGSLSARLLIHGKQGHVAYPQLADNPVHRAAPAITEITQRIWDNGNEFFPATSFQISNIHAGTGANNVIPGDLEILCNFRYSPAVTVDDLMRGVESILKKHQLNYSIAWNHSAQPFLTTQGKLINACRAAIETVTGITPALSTEGGTSDGRFVAPTGSEIIELGVCNDKIHQINECVRITDLEMLGKIYQQLLENLLT